MESRFLRRRWPNLQEKLLPTQPIWRPILKAMRAFAKIFTIQITWTKRRIMVLSERKACFYFQRMIFGRIVLMTIRTGLRRNSTRKERDQKISLMTAKLSIHIRWNKYKYLIMQAVGDNSILRKLKNNNIHEFRLKNLSQNEIAELMFLTKQEK